MKRKIVITLIILVCFLLQSTVFKELALGSISPNLMIIVTSSFGFMRGKKEGLWVGFICGLLEDIFFGRLLGMHAMIYMYIGYANGCFNHIFYEEDIKLPIFLISASELRPWDLRDHVYDAEPFCIHLLYDQDHFSRTFIYDCCDTGLLPSDVFH